MFAVRDPYNMSDISESTGTNPEGRNFWDLSKNLDTMTKAEMKREIKNWRNIYTYISDEQKSFLGQLGQPIMIFKRDGGSFRGNYAGCKVEIIEHRFFTMERIRDDVEKKYFIMRNEVAVPVTNIIDFKWVREQYADTPDPYLQEQEQKLEGEYTENDSNDTKQD